MSIGIQAIACPKCSKLWTIRSEHAVAICKRGKCIGCIADAKERIETNPYEFEIGEWKDPSEGSVVFADVLGPSQTKNPDKMKTTLEEIQRVITELHCGLNIPIELIEQSDSGNYAAARTINGNN